LICDRCFFVEVITITNLLNSSTLKEQASGGFPEYEYPRWSTILGWFIFVSCVLPIPVFFVISYIQQYRRIAAERLVCKIGFFRICFIQNKLKGNGNLFSNDHPNSTNDRLPKPLYLAALTANNSPGETWGPRRKVNQVGIYAYLNPAATNNYMVSKQPYSEQSLAGMNRADDTTINTNPTFDPDQ
jgi:hypothetical protein